MDTGRGFPYNGGGVGDGVVHSRHLRTYQRTQMSTSGRSSSVCSRWFTAAVVLMASLFSAGAALALRIPEGEPARRVMVYSFWNRDYFCVAARVPDTIITGLSNAPMSAPEQDDAIEFDFNLPLRGGLSAHRLIISAAEGMTLLTRDERGNWRSDNSWIRGPRTIKYAVAINGTLNNPKDTDVEFAVECAIPWQYLGGVPSSDREIGFNVVNWMQGDNEGVASWSRYVSTPGEVGETGRWGRMLITRNSALNAGAGTAALCPPNPVEPFIDGQLTAQEWMAASSLSFDKPEPQFAPSPPTAGTPPFGALLAIYRYDWDPGAFWQENGEPATVDQPKEGAGPWYSYTRVDWHRGQLDEVKRAGIDILLPHYRGDAESRRTWARTGLDRMTQALKEMRAEGKSYPLVGMYLDTDALKGADLKSVAGQDLITGMIRDFFLHVPREFRAQLGGGVPVMLGEPEGLADWDGGFGPYVEERLGKIAWLGSAAWREKGAGGFYAYVRLRTSGLGQEGTGGVTALSIAPGYCPPPGTLGDMRPRRDGRAYRADWQRVLAASPELVVIDSWNDFANGTEIAPSRQYGFAYADATRVAKAQLGSGQAHSLRLLQSNAPAMLKPGADYLVEFVIENNGTEDIETGRVITADYRITRRRDGGVVQQRVGAQGLQVLAGQIRRTPVVISTKDSSGRPLPPGEYLFSLVVIKTRVPLLRSSLVAREAAELTTPITVGAPPARKATVISTSLPSSMEAGATEQVTVRLRNDGAETWKAKETRVTYRWQLHYDESPQPDVTVAKASLSGDSGVLMLKDVAPGEVVSVEVAVMAQVGGPETPTLPMLHHYRVQWDVVDKAGSFLEAGQPLCDEAIRIVRSDPGAIVESVSAPLAMDAGGKAEVAVVVGNAGQRAWKAADTAVQCEWYSWDGKRPLLAASPARLPVDVGPGKKTTVVVALEAPKTAGPYRLVWRVVGKEAGQSGRRRDLQVTPVMVRGGAFRALDLSSLTNVVAVTTDSYRAKGDFDGSGRSLPAEGLCPDVSGATEGLYPSGYYAPILGSELPAPFSYPDVSSGVGAAVACDGQSLELGPGVKRVHLLAASTGAAQQITVTLKSADGASRETTVQAPSWLEKAEGVPVAACTRYVRTLNGDDASTPAYLYHLTLAAEGAVRLELPNKAAVKILALTVEAEPAPPATGAN